MINKAGNYAKYVKEMYGPQSNDYQKPEFLN